MKLSEVLEDKNLILSPRGTDMMARAIKQILPHYYRSATNNKWSTEVIVSNLTHMELPEEDILKIIQAMCRLGKIWAFS